MEPTNCNTLFWSCAIPLTRLLTHNHPIYGSKLYHVALITSVVAGVLIQGTRLQHLSIGKASVQESTIYKTKEGN